MYISKGVENGKPVMYVDGKINANTSKDLETELLSFLDENKEMLLDFNKVDYISSAGLRVLLLAQKKVKANGGQMVLRGVCDIVMDVLEMTGFTDILTIK